MNFICQQYKYGTERSWVASLIGALASLAVAASVIIPAQVSAEESEGTYLVIIGAPGSGKSTVSAHISESREVPIIEVGQALRDALAVASKSLAPGKSGSQRANANYMRLKNIEAAKTGIKDGELVNEHLIDATIAANVLTLNTANGYILDGYPASVAQAKFLDALLAGRGNEPIVIYLDVPDDVALARIKARGRVDDVHGFGEKRLELFRKNMGPLLDFYEDGGLYTIDGSMSADDVRAQVDKVLSIDREVSLYYQ